MACNVLSVQLAVFDGSSRYLLIIGQLRLRGGGSFGQGKIAHPRSGADGPQAVASRVWVN
jgi:hypothetical protein